MQYVVRTWPLSLARCSARWCAAAADWSVASRCAAPWSDLRAPRLHSRSQASLHGRRLFLTRRAETFPTPPQQCSVRWSGNHTDTELSSTPTSARSARLDAPSIANTLRLISPESSRTHVHQAEGAGLRARSARPSSRTSVRGARFTRKGHASSSRNVLPESIIRDSCLSLFLIIII